MREKRNFFNSIEWKRRKEANDEEREDEEEGINWINRVQELEHALLNIKIGNARAENNHEVDMLQ